MLEEHTDTTIVAARGTRTSSVRTSPNPSLFVQFNSISSHEVENSSLPTDRELPHTLFANMYASYYPTPTLTRLTQL